MDSCRAQEIHVVLANGSGYAPRQIPVVRQNRTAQYHVDIMKDDLTRQFVKTTIALRKRMRCDANELQSKPLDRELLNRFATEVRGRGKVCDMGCAPGHIARFLRDAGAGAFGLDPSPRMVEQARKLNPDIRS